MPTGYMHPAYAASLSEFGTPYHLENSGGWILIRPIQGTPYRDALGLYPLFTCRNWQGLVSDLAHLRGLVSLSLVTDPFGDFDLAYLKRCFPDRCTLFKWHYIADLQRPLPSFVSAHHRRYARKAMRTLSVEQCSRPLNFLDDWSRLYAVLIRRHDIRGMLTFSKQTFAAQLQVPGLVMFRAIYNEETVGMLLWYIQGEIAYYHLGAFSETGYKMHASFALFWHSMEHLADKGLRWASLGAGAGIDGNATDGLSRFKRGWATETRPAYFCGRIFDLQKYQEITQSMQIPPTNYFPAYRVGEFG